jgi:hypothetical protein
MSARLVPRGEAETSLRNLEKPLGLSGAKYKFLRFPDMPSVAGFNTFHSGVLSYRSEIN